MENWADFEIIWNGGRALLQGQDPYSVADFFYPLPFVYVIAIGALLPLIVALVLWLLVNFAALVYFFRKRFWMWLFYFPVIHLFLSGQNEFLWWTLAQFMRRNLVSAAMAAVMTLKPQTAVILLPFHLLDWLRHDRKTFAQFVGFTALLWGIPLLWQPTWISDWWNAAETGDWVQTARATSGVFSLLVIDTALLPLLAVVAVGIAIWGLMQRKEEVTRAALLLASPVGLFYTQFALLGAAPVWLLTPLSLLAMGLVLVFQSFAPFIIVPLAVIIWHLRHPERHPLSQLPGLPFQPHTRTQSQS